MNSYHREVAIILEKAANKLGTLRKFIYASKLECDRIPRVLDVGCGVGNTTIPLLEANPRLFVYSCDFSTRAIETLRKDQRADPKRCHPFTWDVTDSGGQSSNKKKLLKLCCEVSKYRPWLQKLAEQPSVLAQTEQMRINPSQATVLIYELLFGYWRDAEEGLKDALKRLRDILRTETAIQEKNGITVESVVTPSPAALLPRYVRVNTIKQSLQTVLALLERDGWRIRRLKPGITPAKYRALVSKLAAPKVYVDPHVPDLLIFPSGVDLHDAKLVNEGALVLQDKASCFPAFVLRPTLGTFAVDACAAPGMKTSHLAVIMQNKGTIFAFDRDPKRVQLMHQMLKKAGVNCVRAQCKDFLRIDVIDARFSKVQYAIVDPPCSGSGMAKRGENIDEFQEPEAKRLQALSNLQVMLLKHALRLPSLERLVYSTCSVHWEENEGVVQEALADKTVSARFELVDPLPHWRHRGKSGGTVMPELKLCLRASPKKDLTNGFFVALFQRKQHE